MSRQEKNDEVMFENIHNFIIYNSTVEISSISPNLNKPKNIL